MSDETAAADGEGGIERRAVLKSAAAGAVGVGGLVAAGAGDSAARELADVVQPQGDMTRAEAVEKLRRVETVDVDEVLAADCTVQIKCVSIACAGDGYVATRVCCPRPGCKRCCRDWEVSNDCCGP